MVKSTRNNWFGRQRDPHQFLDFIEGNNTSTFLYFIMASINSTILLLIFFLLTEQPIWCDEIIIFNHYFRVAYVIINEKERKTFQVKFL